MSATRKVLVVEDDPDVRRTLERSLMREGCDVHSASDGRDAIDELARHAKYDLIISDLEMPRADGRAVASEALKHGIPVVILTGRATIETAVELMRLGAANFLTKPFSPAHLRGVLDDAFEGRRGAKRPPTGLHAIVGEDVAFRRMLGNIDSVAETDATVLIRGESGTGKEVVARMIHSASRRAARPFIAVNCGAIPEALIESELFGHTKGAFTGATAARAGRFQLAEGGTLFLDEIGDMPQSAQVKLLRVLQERQYESVGESSSRSADVRVIAATHRNLEALAREGKFREDLFYRINVIDFELPPLRNRRADIPVLCTHFIAAANARYGRAISGVTDEAMTALLAYAWPGNVRQLGNVVERAVILKRTGAIELADLSAEVSGGDARKTIDAQTLPAEGVDLKQALADLEDSLIQQALERTGGNRNAAAQLLGLNRTTLVEKLKRGKAT